MAIDAAAFGFVQSLDSSDSCLFPRVAAPLEYDPPDISAQPSFLQVGYHADFLLEDGTTPEIETKVDADGGEPNFLPILGTVPEPTSWFDSPFDKNWCTFGGGSITIQPSFSEAETPIDVPIGEFYPSDTPLSPLRSF